MKKLILLSGLLFLVISIDEQAKLDSLHLIWNDTAQADTVRLNAMNELIYNFQSRPDSMLVLTELMLDLAKAKGLKQYQADAICYDG